MHSTQRHLQPLWEDFSFNHRFVSCNLCLGCILSPQTISITEEWELLAHEVKVDIDLVRRADTLCNSYNLADLGI